MSDTTYIIAPGERLVDVAIKHFGDASQVFQLLADNPELEGPDAVLVAGAELQVLEIPGSDRKLAEFEMVDVGINPAKPLINEVAVQPDQTITDVVMQEYGDLSYIFQLLEDNPHIQSPDTLLEPGMSLFINRLASEKQKERQYENVDLVSSQFKPLSTETVVYEGQSVIDIALQEYGDITAAIDMLLDSGIDDIGTWMPPEIGTVLSIRKNRVFDAEVTEYYQNRNIRINTGKKNTIEGIGLCSSDDVLLISFDNFILKASDQ